MSLLLCKKFNFSIQNIELILDFYMIFFKKISIEILDSKQKEQNGNF